MRLKIADIITTIHLIQNMLMKRLLKIHLFESGSVQTQFFNWNVEFSEGNT